MKKGIVFFVFFVLLMSGAYAQSVLRDGIYMMQGVDDMVHVYNIPQYKGNFHMTWYMGSNFNNPIYHHAGYTIGNKMLAVIFWINDALLTRILGDHDVEEGLQVIFSITNATTFVDGAGQTWTWRREMPKK